MENSMMSRSTTQACAACKYQRRKCGPNCILAPYFPHERQKQFLNAHRLFGVGRITNMIKPLDPHNRDIAMSTIIYQSDMRAKDPVGGCYRLIQQLQSQIELANTELRLVLQQLALLKAQANSCDVINATPQPYLEQMPQEQQQFISYNPLQEDLNAWALQNSISLSPLSLQDINQEPFVGHGFDQNPVLELMEKTNNSAAGSKH